MSDSWGDGWGADAITIGDMSYTMADGSEETVQVGACEVDPPACEGTEVVVDGGSWQSEVSWTISDCDGNELFAGGAPYAECLDLPALSLTCLMHLVMVGMET